MASMHAWLWNARGSRIRAWTKSGSAAPGDAGRRSLPAGVVGVACLLALASLASAQAGHLAELRRMVPLDSDVTTAVSVGDVDGDGSADVLCANSGQRNRLYLNDCTGLLRDATGERLPEDSDLTQAAALVDVDADGDLDALFMNLSFGLHALNRLLLNNGTGFFEDATAGGLPDSGTQAEAIAIADVDGDDDPDIVVGSSRTLLWLNDGVGHFEDVTATHLPAVLTSTVALTTADVDADGDIDILVGKRYPARSLLYLNDGTGHFEDVTETRLPLIFQDASALATSDVDADGDVDLLVGRTEGPNRLFLNDGTGTFVDVTETHLPSVLYDAAFAVALADVDGDGDPDAMIGNNGYYGTPNRLFLNDGTGHFDDVTSSRMPDVLCATSAVALVDLDGDGDRDVLLAEVGYQNRLYLNDGTGRFRDATVENFPYSRGDVRSVELADVDGDGDLDCLVGAVEGGERLYLNDGAGHFRDVTDDSLPVTGGTAFAFGIADIDGDGDVDIVVGGYEQNRVFLNQGDGRFASATGFPPGSALAVAVGDVDADGDVDVMTGGFSRDRLYLNDGYGRFGDVTETHMPSTPGYSRAVELVDADRDGDLDALLGTADQNRLYLNDGAGHFDDVTETHMPSQVDSTHALAVADVDADGDPDVLFGNGFNDYQNRLYLNDGDGHYSDVTETHLPADPYWTLAVVLEDVDGDGDADALMADAGRNRLYLNDGTGHFVDATTSCMPGDDEESWALAVGDVDGDGDSDAVTGAILTQPGDFLANERIRLYTNLTRQLAWRAVPRVGKPLTLDLYGTPGDSWVLLAPKLGPGGPRTRLGGGLAPVLAAGKLDAEGRAAFTLQVPGNEDLIGLSLDWWAAVGTRLHTTGRGARIGWAHERTTLTGL